MSNAVDGHPDSSMIFRLRVDTFGSRINFLFPFGFGAGGLVPLPPPEGLPVVPGALTGMLLLP